MFINTGGLPEQHRPHNQGELHLQPQHHHHGHRHLQQFGQLHLPHRSKRLTARQHRLPPAPRRRGSLSPAALLLKPGPPPPPRPLLCLDAPPGLLSNDPTRSSLAHLSFTAQRDHKTNMDGWTPQPSLSSLSSDKKNV